MAVQVINPAQRRYVKALFFAPAGHGKTYLLGTAQQDERTAPMLFLDFEGGEETLSGLDIDVVSIRSWDDYSEVYEILTSGEHWKLPGSSLKEGETYRSLGIDSISETHVWALLTILEKNAARRRDPDLIEQGDYGIASTQMRRLLREFRDLPMHVFYTAHSREIDERGVGRVKVPAMAGQLSEEVVGLMSVVGYLALEPRVVAVDGEEVEEAGRLLILKNYPGFRTKVRTPWGTPGPDEIEDPTITKILDALGVNAPGDDEDSAPEAPRAARAATRRRAVPDEPDDELDAGDGEDEDEDDGDAAPSTSPTRGTARRPIRRRRR